MARDSIALLPGSVVVGFPAVDGAKVACACRRAQPYLVTVLALDVAEAAGLDAATIGDDAKRVRSTAIAVFDEGDASSGGSSSGDDDCPEEPTNVEALRALAVRIATDYYAWRSGAYRRDLAFAGTVAWELEGTTDVVVTTFRPDDCRTRVRSAPYNVEPEELFQATDEDHAGPGAFAEWAWLLTPSGGIPRRETDEDDRFVPGSASCEVYEEDDSDDGGLASTGRFATAWNYWRGSDDIAGGTLVRAVPRTMADGTCRLVVVNEDCNQ